jgi:formylglycine-generating enzyme required for sulfatase activity
VIRGGSWGGPGSLRTSYRNWGYADFRNGGIGFRLAQDIE